MGTATSQLIEEAERHVATEEFYWAIKQHMRACSGMEDHLQEMEFAIQWCIDHMAVVSFDTGIVSLQFKYLPPVGTVPLTKVIRAETFLDAIEHAKEFIDVGVSTRSG